MAPQNLYDDDAFFQKYSQFPRALQGEAGASEWPQLQQMLPTSLQNKRVLDLACGEGWFARWCIAQGARHVDACDLSLNMLHKAQSRTLAANNNNGTQRQQIHFSRVDLEKLQLNPSNGGSNGKYDLVFCGLALHYVANIAHVMQQVHGALVAGGMFVFSIEHPFLTAPRRPGFIFHQQTDEGEGEGEGRGQAQWPVDSYFDEGERCITWLVRDVKKQHRTLSSYFALLTGAGFEVLDMAEWGATEHKSRKHPDWVEGVCPRFLLMTARKKEV